MKKETKKGGHWVDGFWCNSTWYPGTWVREISEKGNWLDSLLKLIKIK